MRCRKVSGIFLIRWGGYWNSARNSWVMNILTKETCSRGISAWSLDRNPDDDSRLIHCSLVQCLPNFERYISHALPPLLSANAIIPTSILAGEGIRYSLVSTCAHSRNQRQLCKSFDAKTLCGQPEMVGRSEEVVWGR